MYSEVLEKSCSIRRYLLFLLSDTIFFHLPSRSDAETTIFGISCYRQMDASVNSESLQTLNLLFLHLQYLSTHHQCLLVSVTAHVLKLRMPSNCACPQTAHVLKLNYQLQPFYSFYPLQKLVNRGTDVTRNTVQKSVCVLSKLVRTSSFRVIVEVLTFS